MQIKCSIPSTHATIFWSANVLAILDSMIILEDRGENRTISASAESVLRYLRDNVMLRPSVVFKDTEERFYTINHHNGAYGGIGGCTPSEKNHIEFLVSDPEVERVRGAESKWGAGDEVIHLKSNRQCSVVGENGTRLPSYMIKFDDGSIELCTGNALGPNNTSMRGVDQLNAMDAATLRSTLKVLSDFSGGNANVTQAIRLLRDEEYKYFDGVRARE